MKLRKFLNFCGGILSATAICDSVFLPFALSGELMRKNFSDFLESYFSNFQIPDLLNFPAAYAIFAIAAFFLFFALFQKKFFAGCGVILAFSWLIFLEISGQLVLFGYGTLLFAAGATLGMILLLAPKTSSKKNLK